MTIKMYLVVGSGEHTHLFLQRENVQREVQLDDGLLLSLQQSPKLHSVFLWLHMKWNRE